MVRTHFVRETVHRLVLGIGLAAVAIGCGDDDGPILLMEVDGTSDATTDGSASDGSASDGAHLDADVRDGATVVYLNALDEWGQPLREFMAHHPMTVEFGLMPDENLSSDDVHFGFVEATAPGEDHSTKTTCYLGHFQADFVPEHLESDGSMRFSQEVIIPDHCLAEAVSRTFHFWVGVNPAVTLAEEDDDTQVSDGDYNTQFFTEEGLDLDGRDRNAQCVDGDGQVGCTLALTVHESPGLDIQLENLELESSTIVISDLCQIDHGIADLEGRVTMELYGAASHDGHGEHSGQADILDDTAHITFEICPRELDDQEGNCVSGTDYRPLGVAGHEDATTDGATQTQDSAPMDTMFLGAPHVESFDVHIEHDVSLCQTLLGGEEAVDDWSNAHVFNLRVCAIANGMSEAGPCDRNDMCSPTHHADNNCVVEPVRVVRSFSESTGSATSYSTNYDYSKSSGNSVIGAEFNAYTHNLLNLDGATTENGANLRITGWAAFDAFDLWADASAYVSLVGSGYDIGAKLFGSKVWGASQSIESYEYSDEKTFSKEACVSYTYGVAGVGLNASLCASGSAGVGGELIIDAVEGSGPSPFDASTRIGEAAATVTPTGNISLSATASLNLVAAQGGITGTLTILGVDVPLQGTLNWGLIAVGGRPALVLTNHVSARLELTLLKGSVTYWVKVLSPKWCKCGRWCPGYPCSTWNTVASGTLLSTNGYHLTQTLFDQSLGSPLQIGG